MNISVFGKIIGAFGIAIILISFVAILFTFESALSESEWRQSRNRYGSTYSEYKSAHFGYNLEQLSCLYSGKGVWTTCPINGYSAVFTYVGLFFTVIGGALVVASRKPEGKSE